MSDYNGNSAKGKGGSKYSEWPTPEPTNSPTPEPTNSPTPGPTKAPTPGLTRAPSRGPTRAPSRGSTKAPTSGPTKGPSTLAPPTLTPSTSEPATTSPTNVPTPAPTKTPTKLPTPADDLMPVDDYSYTSEDIGGSGSVAASGGDGGISEPGIDSAIIQNEPVLLAASSDSPNNIGAIIGSILGAIALVALAVMFAKKRSKVNAAKSKKADKGASGAVGNSDAIEPIDPEESARIERELHYNDQHDRAHMADTMMELPSFDNPSDSQQPQPSVGSLNGPEALDNTALQAPSTGANNWEASGADASLVGGAPTETAGLAAMSALAPAAQLSSGASKGQPPGEDQKVGPGQGIGRAVSLGSGTLAGVLISDPGIDDLVAPAAAGLSSISGRGFGANGDPNDGDDDQSDDEDRRMKIIDTGPKQRWLSGVDGGNAAIWDAIEDAESIRTDSTGGNTGQNWATGRALSLLNATPNFGGRMYDTGSESDRSVELMPSFDYPPSSLGTSPSFEHNDPLQPSLLDAGGQQSKEPDVIPSRTELDTAIASEDWKGVRDSAARLVSDGGD